MLLDRRITHFATPLFAIVTMLPIAGVSQAQAQTDAAAKQLSILPIPAHASLGHGAFLLDNGFNISFTGYTEPRLNRASRRFLNTLQAKTGIRRWADDSSLPQLVINTRGASAPVQRLGEDESYHLEVTSTKTTLTAANPLGILRGLQTFVQLVQPSPAGFVVPAITIDDTPRFPWRGLMIDTGRHFMPLDVIRQNIDGMETVKLNILHWHVSEDQGFRIESKVYPKLTAMGSDGLFYTQEEVRDIVAYARDRGIRVMPEFEMPSHAASLYLGYPELADGSGPYFLKRKFGEKWGRERKASEDSSMDPTRETTYTFLDKVIGEMSGLFPDAYFHVGGDAEDAVTEWGTNAHIKQYMKDHNVKDTAALQVYFTDRVQKIVAKHQKTMVGWDEVLQQNTPKDVVIQSWRGLDSLGKAVQSGHRGILSWGYYLDLSEPASRHYSVDPFDKENASLTAEQKKSILGGETAMWTEYVSAETVGGRIWPRAAAVAERLWSQQDVTDLDSIYRRLDIVSQELTYAGLPFLAVRNQMYQRLVGNGDPAPLKVLGSIVEPPKGFPREGQRAYDVYSPLNHLSDIVPSESTRARDFRNLADRIAANKATSADWQQARAWLTLWRDNDAALEPMLGQSNVTAELAMLSKNLTSVSVIGLAALDALEKQSPVTTAQRDQYLGSLKALNIQQAELTNMVIPSVEKLVLATKP